MAVDVSILIVSWNTRELVAECLASIEQTTQHLHVEVIVRDNGSRDGTAEMIRKRFPWVTLSADCANEGFAKGNNIAARCATGKYVFVLNPDTRLTAGAIETMIDVLEQHPEIGIVGPHLIYPDGSHQDSVRRFPTFLSHVLVLLKCTNLFPNLAPLRSFYAKDMDYTNEQKVDQVMGAAFIMRRDVFEQLHGFDEDYWIWMEEVDLMKRVRKIGLSVYYTPNATVIHHRAKSFSQSSKISRSKRFAVSSAVYFRKHHSRLAWLMILALVPIHLALTLLYSWIPYGHASSEVS